MINIRHIDDKKEKTEEHLVIRFNKSDYFDVDTVDVVENDTHIIGSVDVDIKDVANDLSSILDTELSKRLEEFIDKGIKLIVKYEIKIKKSSMVEESIKESVIERNYDFLLSEEKIEMNVIEKITRSILLDSIIS